MCSLPFMEVKICLLAPSCPSESTEKNLKSSFFIRTNKGQYIENFKILPSAKVGDFPRLKYSEIDHDKIFSLSLFFPW